MTENVRKFKQNNNDLLKLLLKISPLLFGLILILLYRYFLIIGLLLILDFFKIYIKTNFKIEFPLDFGLFSLIILGYLGHPWLSLLIFPIILFNRLIHGLVKETFLIKFPLIIIISFIASFLHFIDFGVLGASLVVFRYIAEYLLELSIFKTVAVEKIHWRLLHIAAAYIIYETIGKFILILIV